MAIQVDGDDFIPYFYYRSKLIKLYIHDEGDGTFSFSSKVVDGDKFATKAEAWTLIDAVKAWFETL